MPLHLLQKKSWNVYNAANIERVRRDEALAKAREEEEERRMQEVDAQHRMNLLRGVRTSPPTQPVETESKTSDAKGSGPAFERGSYGKRRRRLPGEDDTDRDIRLAKEDAALVTAAQEKLQKGGDLLLRDASLVDQSGHINLFPSEASARSTQKNPEAEAEKKEKRKEEEDQYTLRFSNAAGFKQNIASVPWYTTSTAASEDVGLESQTSQAVNVWGNADPARKERDKVRLDSNDPLTTMKRGVHTLRQVEQERKTWKEEKDREIEELKLEQRLRERRKHRHKHKHHDRDESCNGRIHKRRRNEDEHSRSGLHEGSRSGETRHHHSGISRGKQEANRDVAWSPAPGKRYSAQFAKS